MRVDLAWVFRLKLTFTTFHKALGAMSALIDFIFERQLTNVTFTEGYYMHLDVLAVMVSISEFVPTQHTDIGHKGGVHTGTGTVLLYKLAHCILTLHLVLEHNFAT